ncbi:amino acid permease-domain-containing protein [Biscogniauxia mediterranea]|nr:amino acid permease-domain-containing protein [Biscogniauxia mediterranea]
MVPPPLDFSNLVSPKSLLPSLFSEALTTAASPLRNNFELSCRSPLTPSSRVRRGAGGGVTATTPKYPASASHLSISRHAPSLDSDITYDGEFSTDGDDASSLTAFSPSDHHHHHPWVSPPSTPALLLGKGGKEEEEGKLGVISTINIIVGKTLGVGAYTIPSAVFAGVGSVGMSLALWAVGSAVSFCGLAVYLELGTALPRSGGERVYLERIFGRPRMLATCMFMSYVVLLGFSAPNAIVLGEYALYALGVEERGRWAVRAIAALAVSALCCVHARRPRLGLALINVLGAGKLLMLAVVVVSGLAGGWVGLGGGASSALAARRADPVFTGGGSGARLASSSTAQRNFSDVWAGTSTQPYDYATALLKVIYCFRGYSTANQVLSEVRDPARTLRVAAPAALAVVSLAYLAVSVAFFLVVDKEDFRASGVVAAGVFFRNLFGEAAGAHVLPFFVIVSAAGNIAATSFAQARVNEELAKDGLLPWSRFWSSSPSSSSSASGEKKKAVRNRSSNASFPPPKGSSARPAKTAIPTTSTTTRTRRTAPPPPSRGLLLHWLVTVAVIVLPPTDRIYNFLVNIGGYPVSVVSVAIGAGLLHLRANNNNNNNNNNNSRSDSHSHSRSSPPWRSPLPARRPAVLVFLVFNTLLLVLPWVPPRAAPGADSGFPYYAYPATALAVLGSGAVYWAWWRRGRGRGRGREGSSDIGGGEEEESRGLLGGLRTVGRA